MFVFTLICLCLFVFVCVCLCLFAFVCVCLNLCLFVTARYKKYNLPPLRASKCLFLTLQPRSIFSRPYNIRLSLAVHYRRRAAGVDVYLLHGACAVRYRKVAGVDVYSLHGACAVHYRRRAAGVDVYLLHGACAVRHRKVAGVDVYFSARRM